MGGEPAGWGGEGALLETRPGGRREGGRRTELAGPWWIPCAGDPCPHTSRNIPLVPNSSQKAKGPRILVPRSSS